MNEAQLQKVLEAQIILKELGFPKQQYNQMCGLVLLTLANVEADSEWANATSVLLTTHFILGLIRINYGVNYAPNSRETIRRHCLHQFEQAGVLVRNRDKPDRATNSALNNYSLNPEIIEILKFYPDGKWKEEIHKFNLEVPKLIERYNREREIHKVPIKLPNGKSFTLSPGPHNKLHADIIHEFCATYVGEGGEVLYIGDTASSRNEGGKMLHLESKRMEELNIPQLAHDKLPDVVVYDSKRNWLFLIEAVTSHGPVSSKRWEELEEAFKDSEIGRVYVTAFPDSTTFRKYAADIAWETEVWIADKPTHMIHFNGDRFLGPHSK
jgi:hypothetical protein